MGNNSIVIFSGASRTTVTPDTIDFTGHILTDEGRNGSGGPAAEEGATVIPKMLFHNIYLLTLKTKLK